MSEQLRLIPVSLIPAGLKAEVIEKDPGDEGDDTEAKPDDAEVEEEPELEDADELPDDEEDSFDDE